MSVQLDQVHGQINRVASHLQELRARQCAGETIPTVLVATAEERLDDLFDRKRKLATGVGIFSRSAVTLRLYRRLAMIESRRWHRNGGIPAGYGRD